MSAVAWFRQPRSHGHILIGMKPTAILPVVALLPSCFAQTKPLSVCDILKKPADWNNNIVLLRAHYGSGMEDAFLYDERCPGQEIWFDYPGAAAHEDAIVEDSLAPQRTPANLKQDDQFMEFEKYARVRDEKRPMCPGVGSLLTVRGRIDSQRDPRRKNKNKCEKPFGMCNYPARLVLESVQSVALDKSKPQCK